MPAKQTQPHLSKPLIVLLLVGLVTSFFLWSVKGILTSFIVGLVLAYLLDPIVNKLGKVGVNRTLSSLLPVVTFYLLVAAIFAFLLPGLIKDGFSFLSSMPPIEETVKEIIPQIENHFGVSLSIGLILGWIGKFGQEILHGLMVSLGQFSDSLFAIGNLISFILITPLVAFYMLHEWPHIKKFTAELIPPKQRTEVVGLCTRIDGKISGFIRGQMGVCLIQGLVYGTGLWLAGVKLGFLLGLMTGLLSFIPVVGGLLGMVVTLVVAMIQFQFGTWVPYALILGIFAFGNILESFVLSPKLLGNSVGLHPVWIIFALMAGGHLAGIVGMLVAVPVAAALSEIIALALKYWRESESFKK